jgi:hypothetical protein
LQSLVNTFVDFGFWILDFGLWIADYGFWLERI